MATGTATFPASVVKTADKYEKVTKNFEYLDHTADVQIHAWGETLQSCYEQTAMGMFNYMADIDTVIPERAEEITAEGDDLQSLMFHFLDEFLFLMSCEPFFMVREVQIVNFDKENFKIRAIGYGENFDSVRHGGQGTEIKAITYSAMQIVENDDRKESFVIVDI